MGQLVLNKRHNMRPPRAIQCHAGMGLYSVEACSCLPVLPHHMGGYISVVLGLHQ